MRFETARLVLRDFVDDDWRALLAIESRPEVVRYQSFDAHTEVTAREYIAKAIADALEEPRLVFDFAILLDNAFIGRTGFRRDANDPRIGEMWFNVAPEQQGQGYATEAARALVDFAFRDLAMHRMFGDCDPRNPASARVMERLGMRREAHLVENVYLKGEWCDSLIYAVLAREWGNPPR